MWRFFMATGHFSFKQNLVALVFHESKNHISDHSFERLHQ